MEQLEKQILAKIDKYKCYIEECTEGMDLVRFSRKYNNYCVYVHHYYAIKRDRECAEFLIKHGQNFANWKIDEWNTKTMSDLPLIKNYVE